MELHTYYLCLLRKGPAWTAEESPALEELQARHLAHNRELFTSGATLASGPVDDGSDIRGISIFRTATIEEARSLAENDPGVHAGRFILEFHPWMVPAGTFPAPAMERERE